MKECDNSSRKIHISSNLILSISLEVDSLNTLGISELCIFSAAYRP